MKQLTRYFLLFVCFVLALTKSYSKDKNIYYQIPPKPDSIVSDYINKERHNLSKNDLLYCVLEKDNETYRLTIEATYQKDKKNIALKSNRFIRLQNNILLPVFFEDFDNVFIDQNYGYTERGEFMSLKRVSLRHSFFILFNMSNQVIKVSYNGW